MTKAINGKIHVQGLELNALCDVCGRDRAHGNHKRCSRIRQEKYRKEAESSAQKSGKKSP